MYAKFIWGVSRYNGFGGKIEPGESPLEAAKRELQVFRAFITSHVAQGADSFNYRKKHV